MIYFLIFAGLCCIRYATGKSGVKNRFRYYVLLGLLFLFAGFRYEVGPDWTGYLNIYEIQQQQSAWRAATSGNPGFWLMNELVHQLGWPYPVVNVLSSAVFFAGLHVIAHRQPDPLGFLVLAFPIFIINMPMSGIRQAMGAGFLCIALTAFIDRRLVAFAFWVGVGSLFHMSAIVFLLLLPLVTGQYTKQRLVFAAILALPGLYLLSMSVEAEQMKNRYLEGGVEASGAIFRVATLLVTGAFFMITCRERWQRLFPGDYTLVSIGALMMLGSFPVIFVSTVLADRFGYYLIPIQTMIYTRIPYLFEGSGNKILYSCAPYVGLLALFFVWTQFSTIFQAAYLPYQTWLFGFPRTRF